MNNFISLPTPELIFGIGSLSKLTDLLYAADYKNIVLITGSKSFTNSLFWEKLVIILKKSEISYYHYQSTGETSPDVVDGIILDLKDKNVDAVVAIGGGTVLDTGKAVSAMLCMEGSIVDYLEGVGTKIPTGKRKPLICIPTTSGTGSEATKNAVITKIAKDGYKKSLRHKGYIPDTVIIDPDLIKSCPVSVTVSTGLDAVTQLLESYVSTEATPFTDNLALYGLKLAGRSLPELVKNGDNIEARSEMAYAAYLSGISLANAGLGVIHGAASVLGSMRSIPHGVVCGTLIGSATEIIISKLSGGNSLKDEQALRKYAEAGSVLTGNNSYLQGQNLELLIKTLNTWVEDFNIPGLSYFGFTRVELDYAAKITGLKNTPVELGWKDIKGIFLARL